MLSACVRAKVSMESRVFCQQCMKVMLIAVLLTSAIAEAVPSADLESSPDLSSLSGGGLCPGPILLTCTVTELPFSIWKTVEGSEFARYNPSERDSLTVPFVLPLDIPGVQLEVTRVMQVAEMSDNFNMESTLTANASVVVQNFRRASIQCGTSNKTSNSIPINFYVIETPPLLPTTNCSLVASTGGVEMTFQWPSAFNSDYTVERYRVTVTPEPSSCSSDQVPPSDNYSCSGLDPETDYSITVSAINCGDQEGASFSFNVQPQLLAPEPPQNVVVTSEFNKSGLIINVFWTESTVFSERCSFSGDVNYNLTLESGRERMVGSESCINGSCSTIMSTSSTDCAFYVQIVASNIFGSSDEVVISNEVPSRLTSTNIALLVLGVVLWCVTLVGLGVVMIMMRFKLNKVSFILLSCGSLLLLVSVVLWVAVGFQVGLQDNTCDVDWQRSRNAIIISAFVIAVVSFAIIAVLMTNFLCRCDCRKREASPLEPPVNPPTLSHSDSNFSILQLNPMAEPRSRSTTVMSSIQSKIFKEMIGKSTRPLGE